MVLGHLVIYIKINLVMYFIPHTVTDSTGLKDFSMKSKIIKLPLLPGSCGKIS